MAMLAMHLADLPGMSTAASGDGAGPQKCRSTVIWIR